MSQLYILYESASGYCLFSKEEFDEAGGQLHKIQKSIGELDRFAKMVKLAAYQPFTTAEEALENIMAVKDNKVTKTLKNFLTTHLPSTKSSKKQKFLLGVTDPKLGPEIFENTGISASYNESIVELLRGIRTHFVKIMKSKCQKQLILQQKSTKTTSAKPSSVSAIASPAPSVPVMSTAKTSPSSRLSPSLSS